MNNKPQPTFIINAQYVRDLSFENPLAPKSLFGSKERPNIELAIDIKGQRIQEESYELVLSINAKALAGSDIMFIAELSYAGIFTIPGLSTDAAEPVLLIDCAQTLYPFARRVIADVTRDGGFPPLVLEPVDFKALYVARKQAAAAPATATVN